MKVAYRAASLHLRQRQRSRLVPRDVSIAEKKLQQAQVPAQAAGSLPRENAGVAAASSAVKAAIDVFCAGVLAVEDAGWNDDGVVENNAGYAATEHYSLQAATAGRHGAFVYFIASGEAPRAGHRACAAAR